MRHNQLSREDISPLMASLLLSSSFSLHPKPISSKTFLSPLLDREWMLPDPATPIHRVSFSKLRPSFFSFSGDPRPVLSGGGIDNSPGASFFVVRDDLLHPLANGNKARKLDAVMPAIQRNSTTDVVTCGGCQSAHAAALAVYCAERGIRSHLLLRGEQPQIPTGYNLVSLMYGNVKYVPRSEYSHRKEMLHDHARALAGCYDPLVTIDEIIGRASVLDEGRIVLPQTGADQGSRRFVIINEGAGDALALLGLVRLINHLSQAHVFGKQQQITLVLDAGSGTTAVGLALGAICLGLPWEVTAVMLADSLEKHKDHEKGLISEFKRIFRPELPANILDKLGENIVNWVERVHQRKFGKVLDGEIELCRQIAQETGILLDPMYTLAAWEHSILLSIEEAQNNSRVVMLHTGGTLGLFGLAQRYAQEFCTVR